MKLLYLCLSFFSLFLLDFYLKSNISGINQGSLNLPVLVIFVALCGLFFLWRACISQSVMVRRSTWFLMLFLAYFVFRIVVDLGTTETLKGYTLGTSGGIILFYFLGAMVAVISSQNFSYSVKSHNYYRYFTILVLVYLIASLILLSNIYLELDSRLREDIFLISELGGAYQRPGNFLVISYLILLALYAQFIALNKKFGFARKFTSSYFKSPYYKIVSFLSFLSVMLYSLMSLLIAQMIGSNSATVLIAVLLLITLSVVLLLWIKNINRYLLARKLSFFKLIFGKLSFGFLIIGILGVVFLAATIFVISSYLGIDLTMTRLAGFGTGEISSVRSRLALLDNFIIQFSYAPIFGNMNVDCLTIGCGSYVHSFLATSLTHTGVLGFSILLVYFLLAYKERFKLLNLEPSQMNTLISNIYNLFSILFFSAILLIAILATSIISITIWFAMGLFLSAAVFRGRYE